MQRQVGAAYPLHCTRQKGHLLQLCVSIQSEGIIQSCQATNLFRHQEINKAELNSTAIDISLLPFL